MMNLNLTKNECLYERLSAADKPICIYGMGNGADKIVNELESRGIAVSDYFASDGFVRGHSFRGKTVLSYSDVKQKYSGEFIALLAFGTTRPDVMEMISRIASECELYIPDVPVCGGPVFDSVFFEDHRPSLEEARDCLCDDASKTCFDSIVRYRLSGKLSDLNSSVLAPPAVLKEKSYTSFADLGAYNGDTIRGFMEQYPTLKKVYAMEPDVKTFAKLGRFTDQLKENGSEIEFALFNAAAADHSGTVLFSASGNRNSGTAATSDASFKHKLHEIPCEPLDKILGGASVDYIKLDVEGAEDAALDGAAQTIAVFKPDLAVSAYHKSADLFKLILKLRRMCPDHKLYLSRPDCFPAWDITIHAIL